QRCDRQAEDRRNDQTRPDAELLQDDLGESHPHAPYFMPVAIYPYRVTRVRDSRMTAFVLRRLMQALVVMLAVGLIAFALFRFVGDPVIFMLGPDAPPEDRSRMTHDLGLDRPFYVQYAGFVSRAMRGEFGLSLRQLRPVSTLVAERLPATLELSLAAALL